MTLSCRCRKWKLQSGQYGNVIVHVHGIAGQDCVALTEALEQAVGTVEDRTFTPEYYEQPVRTDGFAQRAEIERFFSDGG